MEILRLVRDATGYGIFDDYTVLCEDTTNGQRFELVDREHWRNLHFDLRHRGRFRSDISSPDGKAWNDAFDIARNITLNREADQGLVPPPNEGGTP